MRYLFVALLLAAACPASAHGQQGHTAAQPGKFPLLQRGTFQEIRNPLEAIFAFYLDGANLAIDRGPSEAAAEQAINDFNKKREEQAEKVSKDEKSGIETLFLMPIAEAGLQFAEAESGVPGACTYRFNGEKLSGTLMIQGKYARMTLEEMDGSGRTLDFGDDGAGSLHIQVSHPNGDLVLLRQARRGHCAFAVILGDRTAGGAGDSFREVFRKHRKEMEELVLPTLAHHGVEVLPTPRNPRVRSTVLKLLARTPETVARGRALLDDLESPEFAARQKARRLLSEKFEAYQDLVAERLENNPSLELRTQLKKIVSENLATARVGQAVAAMELLKDVRYLVHCWTNLPPRRPTGLPAASKH